MTAYEKLVMGVQEIVSSGCGCDHSCDLLNNAEADCGCYDDAKKIVDLVLDTISRQGQEG